MTHLKYTEAIILAGGKGTRLQSVVADLPKPMVPIGKEPFLAFLMRYLIRQGGARIIFPEGNLCIIDCGIFAR
ncbi:MAG: hypothetical protein CSB03_00100 [Bacteroidia bacterium]|nr:MAG: hypothetical protein CSB03_00100 [Bacteroidia bacterium]